MAGNSMKPIDGHFEGGSYGNIPVMYDATGTPVTSPVAAGQTGKELIVPASAVQFVVLNPTGSSGAVTVAVKGKNGTFALSPGDSMSFDCGGMPTANDTAWPTTFLVTTAADTTAQFYFNCTTPTGA